MNLTDWIDKPFQTLLALWEYLQEGMSLIIDFLTKEVNFDWYHDLPEWLKGFLRILSPLIDLLPEGNISILSLMLGGGITVFLVLTVAKWVIGIVT